MLIGAWACAAFAGFLLAPSPLWSVFSLLLLLAHALSFPRGTYTGLLRTLAPFVWAVGAGCLWFVPALSFLTLLSWQTFLALRQWEIEAEAHQQARESLHHWALVGLLSTGLMLLALFAWLWPYTVDDAFYTFQHGRHFLAGHGFVFTPGVRVEGFSSPLWAFLLAALEWLTSLRMHTWSKILGTLLTLATLGMMVQTHLRWLRPGEDWRSSSAALWSVLLILGWLVTQPGFGFFAITGLETVLAAFLITTALYGQVMLWQENRDAAWPYLPMALLAVTRPEAPMFLALLFVVRLVVRIQEDGTGSLGVRWRRAFWEEWKPAFWVGLIPLTWILYRWFFYHDIFPNPYYAKPGQFFHHPWRSLAIAGQFLQFDVFGYRDYVRVCNVRSGSLLPCFEYQWLVGWKVLWWMRGALLVSLLGLGLRALLHPRVRWIAWRLVPFALGASYFLLHGAMNAWMKHTRFLQPYLPILLLLPLLGLWSFSPKWRLRVVLVLCLLLPSKLPSTWIYATMIRGNHIVDHAHRSDNLVKMASWLKKNLPKKSSVLLSEIGALAYYTDLKMVDEAGITDRQVAKILSRGNFNHYPGFFRLKKSKAWYRDKRDVLQLLLRKKPDYVIFHSRYLIPMQDFEISVENTPPLEQMKFRTFHPEYRFVRGFWVQSFKRFLLFERISARKSASGSMGKKR